MTDLFKASESADNNALQEGESYLSKLVGEGKKFATVEDLARGKWESDAFIPQLQKENEGMRNELQTRMTLEEFWEKTQSQQKRTNDDGNDNRSQDRQGDQAANAPKPEDIMDLVRKTLQEETSKSQVTKNVEMVREELIRQWGPNFAERLNIRAKELGSTPEFLGSMAESQPKAFLALMLGNTKNTDSGNTYVPPRSSVNLPMGNTSGKNYAHYEKLRKNNPSEYWKPHVQNEMVKLAKEMGEAFYKS